ncbi:MAG: FHA domain-containing protein [Pseudomonadota bacterium]|nr:FHA domain-containing protein [Pseudomonadota bacterium]
MNQNSDNFVVESTPVLDLKKHGLEKSHSEPGLGPAQSWDADRTEVYADIEDSDAIASLIADSGESYPITTFPFIIGRGSECDLVLQGKGVSRKHAEIVFQSGRFVVNDMESLNGIKVNGYKVARVILEENDVIKLGEVSLTFHSGEGAIEPSPENEKQAKSGLFGKRKSEVAAQDDTFGPSPAKKVASAVVLVLAVGIFAYAGVLYFQNGSAPEGIALNAPASPANNPATPPAVTPPRASASPNVAPPAQTVAPVVEKPAPVSQVADVAAPPPASSIAPPPSLAIAPTRAEKVADPAPTAAVPPPVAPKPAPKPAPNLNSQAAAAQSTAQSLYIQGKAPQALDELKKYIGNAAVSASYQNRVKGSYRDIDSLYSQYTDAQKAFAAGDKDRAFSIWTDFMSRESALLDGQKSVYSRSIVTKVMDEYVERGNRASNEGDYHSAYNYWSKAVELGDSVSAKIAIDNLNNKARQLYRQALRLEYVNTNKAKAMWAEVTQLLPPGTEYHTKASAKLAWYEKWGS